MNADMTSEKGLGQLSPKGMMRTSAQQDPVSEVQSKGLLCFCLFFFFLSQSSE